MASFLISREGMTQGYPLAMVAYGIDIFLLIKQLKALFPHLTQPCYAENDGALGTFTNIEVCFNLPRLYNPGRGYYPEASKIVLLVHPDNPEY